MQLYFFVFFGPNILLKSCSQRNIYIYFFHNAHCTDLFTSVFAAYLCLLLKILLRSVDLRHHAGVSHIMPPANWYVGSPSGRDRNHNNFLRLIVPPTSSPIAPAPKCTHQTSHLVKLWKLWIPHSKPLLSPRLTSKRYILLPRKLCHSVRSAEQKRRFFLLRVFLGSCARTSIFSKFTLRKSKKRKAPQTNLTILRCVPHPPRTSGPRQLPCRVRGRRRRGH